MAQQGKCMKCKVRWVWKKNVKISLARCPVCGLNLRTTNWHLKWPAKTIRGCHIIETITREEELKLKGYI